MSIASIAAARARKLHSVKTNSEKPVLDLKIESGVPIPQMRRESKFAYPFEQLKVNDSVLIPLNGDPVKIVASRIHSQLRRLKPKEFTSRVTSEGIRVWLVSNK